MTTNLLETIMTKSTYTFGAVHAAKNYWWVCWGRLVSQFVRVNANLKSR